MLNDVPRTKDSGSAPEVDFAVQVYSDIACNRCGCVCDDLSISVAQDRIVEFQPHCSVANPWFESLRTALPSSPADINGRDVDLEEALDDGLGDLLDLLELVDEGAQVLVGLQLDPLVLVVEQLDVELLHHADFLLGVALNKSGNEAYQSCTTSMSTSTAALRTIQSGSEHICV